MLRRHIRRVWSSHGSYFGETQSSQNIHGENPILRLLSTAKHQLNLNLRVVCLLAKSLWSLSYGNITLLESDHDIAGYQVSDLISKDIRTLDLASDWLIANFGTVKTKIKHTNGTNTNTWWVSNKNDGKVKFFNFKVSERKRNKIIIFSPTPAFSFCFTWPH